MGKKVKRNRRKGEHLGILESESEPDQAAASTRPAPTPQSEDSTSLLIKGSNVGAKAFTALKARELIQASEDGQLSHRQTQSGPTAEDLARHAAARAVEAAEKAQAQELRKRRKEEQKKNKEELRRREQRQALQNYALGSVQKAPKSLKENLTSLGFGLMIVFVAVGILLLRMGEEGWSQSGVTHSSDGTDVDLYKALEVERSSTGAEIKKAYRKLSLRWHPDKNPNCDACLTKFRQLTKAYEVLGDAEKRKAYDLHSGVLADALASSTLNLNVQNYDKLIHPNDMEGVWVIQLYSDHDELCRSFAPVWEETASQLGRYVNFARINVKKDKAVLKKLPIRPGYLPTVFMMDASHKPHIFGGIFDPDPEMLRRWILYHYGETNLYRLRTPVDLVNFVYGIKRTDEDSQDKPTILVVSQKDVPGLSVKAAAAKWRNVAAFAQVQTRVFYHTRCAATNDTDSSVKAELCGDLLRLDSSQELLVALPPPAVARGRDGRAETSPDRLPLFLTHMATPRRDAAKKLYSNIYALQEHFTPFLHSRNVDLLCRSNDIHRVYCLVVIDAPSSSNGNTSAWALDTISDALATSKAQYKEDEMHVEKEKRDSDDSNGDAEAVPSELQHIQLVRLSTDPLKQFSVANVRPFMQWWSNNLNRTKAILIDLDGNRFMPFSESRSLDFTAQLYQNLVDELLNFEALPDQCDTSAFAKQCLHYDAGAWYKRVYRAAAQATLLQCCAFLASVATLGAAVYYFDPRILVLLLFFTPAFASLGSAWEFVKTLIGRFM